MNNNCNLKICLNDKKKEIFIPEKSLFLNTLVLGNKGSGKSSLIFKGLAFQIIENKNMGGTFVVSSKDLSYELYLLAKHNKRRVVFFNPSVSADIEMLLNKNVINDEDILNICNFEKFIYNNYIVIIDMENIKTGINGCNLVKSFLENLSNSIYNTDVTYLKPHSLYIDDAFYYLDSLEKILYYGSEYNIATTLFFQNRHQFKFNNKDYTSFIDSNIGNIILTNNLNIEDAKFYGEIIDMNLSAFAKSRGKVFYSLRNKDGAKFNGIGDVCLNEKHNEIIYEQLYPVKRALKRKKLKEVAKSTKSMSNNTKNIEISKANEKNIVDDSKNEISNDLVINKEDILFKDKESSNKDKTLFLPNINDDGKIELTLDWDDDF